MTALAAELLRILEAESDHSPLTAAALVKVLRAIGYPEGPVTAEQLEAALAELVAAGDVERASWRGKVCYRTPRSRQAGRASPEVQTSAKEPSMSKSKEKSEAPESAALVRLDPQVLIERAIENKADVETLERLFALAKEVRALQGKEAYLAAMARFQEDCPPIRKTRAAKIATRSGGSYSYAYAPLQEILSKAQPVMGPLGLSISFRVKHEPDRVIAQCRVSHELGHSEESGEVAIPLSLNDGAGATAAQHVGIASTYAKRYALLAMLGIAPEDDPELKAEASIEMPRRSSQAPTPAAAPAAPAREPETWVGKILNAKISRTGKKTDGTPWTLYVMQTSDAQEFVTFSETHFKFAKEAGASRVRVVWEPDGRGGKKVVSVEPEEAQADAGS